MTQSTLCYEHDEYQIKLYQHGPDNFAVIYGLQVDDSLDYSRAAAKLGQAIMHALACDYILDNRTPEEAWEAVASYDRTTGDNT
jgi:hypothetical protein